MKIPHSAFRNPKRLARVPATTVLQMDVRPHSLCGLYAITPGALCREPQRLYSAVAAALSGDARLLQYRDKSSGAAQLRDIARELLQLCRRHQVPLIINDDAQLAADIGADGVHLGMSDAPLSQARALLGARAIIGVTCGNRLERARAAQDGGASYISFGRFFDSRTKPNAPPAGIEVLNEARRTIRIPICAIGGVTPQNAASLIEAGANMVAAGGGLFDAPDIRVAAQEYSRLFA